jgi:solute carrier family 39 (zinc transporter), member 1/2/3
MITLKIYLGIATGTLLYVIFFELLKKDSMKFIQYTAAVIGFLFIFGLQFLSQYNILK